MVLSPLQGNPGMPMPDPSYGGGQPSYGAAPGIGFGVSAD